MKKVIMMAVLAFTSNVFAADEFHLSCQFLSSSSSIGSTTVKLACAEGSFTLSGSNNSPCKAADHLQEFFAGSLESEAVEIDGLVYSSSGMGGVETNIDVVLATRANSEAVLEAPTVLNHGQPKKCNTTHVRIFRTR